MLIHSAGGGVGIAATQLAKRAGAEVWGTASPGKHDAIRGFGVDHPVDYTTPGWERGVPETVAWYESNRAWWAPLLEKAPVNEDAWDAAR